MLKNCWRSRTAFPLHSALTAVTPFVEDEGFAVYEANKIAGVAMEKVLYFGASMFWCSCVHDWRIGVQKERRNALGPYQEALRLYLLGRTETPNGIVFLVSE